MSQNETEAGEKYFIANDVAWLNGRNFQTSSVELFERVTTF